MYTYTYYTSNPAWKRSHWCPLNPAMKLIQEYWGSKCASHHFLHAKGSSWLLQVTGRHLFNLKVSFYGSSWLATDDFLTYVYVVMILASCIPNAWSHSQSRDCIHERESFRFNLCTSGTFYFISSPLSFMHVPTCTFHSECCKEMLLFLFYPSLDWVKDDFKIRGYIKALLSQEHNKSVN